MAIGEAPVLETLADINAVSIARSELDPATLILVRVAALVAVDAPPASYLMHIGPALESGLTVADIQDVLVAVAPITGAPRVLSAARKITEALGIAIAVVEELAEEEADEGSGQVPAQASASPATAS
jgi:alkylhydroperoxidase/carboxymuconolactone decarboxylase family protein YurZ